MENYVSLAGFPARFTPPSGVFPLRYSDNALETAKHMGLDMTYLPLQVDTKRATLVEIVRDGDTTERLGPHGGPRRRPGDQPDFPLARVELPGGRRVNW